MSLATPVPQGVADGVQASPAIVVTCLRLFGLILAACIVGAGFTGYPIPFGDASSFMPASIQMANGHGLTDPVYFYARQYDTLGQARLIYHGFGFEYLLALLIRPLTAIFPTASQASVAALGIIHAVCVLAVNEMSVQFVRRGRRHVVAGLVAAMGLTAFLAVGCYVAGRPDDTAAIPVALLLILIRVRGVSLVTMLVGGFLVGTVAVISPIPAAMTGLLFAAFLAAVEDSRQCLMHAAIVAIVAVATFCALTEAFYPYPIGDMIHGMQLHAARVTGGRDLGLLVPVFFLTGDMPFVGLPLLLLLASAVALCIRLWRTGQAGILLPVFLLAFIGMFIFSAVANPYTMYNVLPIWPAFLAYGLWRIGSRDSDARASLPAWYRYALLVGFALPSIGFFRMVLLYPFFLVHGLPQAQAQTDFAKQLAAITESPIGVSRSGFLWTDDYSRIIDFGDQPPPYPIQIMQQYRYGRTAPPEEPGYTLVFENYDRDLPRLFGVAIGHTIPGYEFAIYRRIAPDGPPFTP